MAEYTFDEEGRIVDPPEGYAVAALASDEVIALDNVFEAQTIVEYSYIYNGSSLTQMVRTKTAADGTETTDTLYFTYAGGTPQTVTHNGTLYYYVTNLQGDVVAILDSSGTAVVEYTYDAWGNILSMSDTSGVNLGNLNPLRYRGYVYDTESGLYYLQSRYYDPEIGRFINADALVSTGQGPLGNNMFAYCGNNPVNRFDSTGNSWLLVAAVVAVCAYILTGCSGAEPSPRPDLANAPDLDVTSASNESYNCYGNAIGKQIVTSPTGYQRGDSVEDTFKAVQNDLGGEANCIKLDSYDSPIEDGWYVVAMMCGPTDYHFIRLDENGWYNKSGSNPYVGGCYIPDSYVHANTWNAIGEVFGTRVKFTGPGDPVYYNVDGPLYFAVRSGWDE